MFKIRENLSDSLFIYFILLILILIFFNFIYFINKLYKNKYCSLLNLSQNALELANFKCL